MFGLKRWQKLRRQRQAVERHLAENGTFHFRGHPVRVPDDCPLYMQHFIASGDYEAGEAELIERHLPPDLPVIELGGCLGFISGHIGRRLAPGVPHVVVEGNPDLKDVCSENATLGHTRKETQVVSMAVAYGVRSIAFHVDPNVHVSGLAAERQRGRLVEVPATTLEALLERIGSPDRYSLVCDIEGAEVDVLEHGAAALAGCHTAIIELHPQVYESRGLSLDGVLASAEAAGLVPLERRDDVFVFAGRGRQG